MKKYHRQIQSGALVLSLALLSSGCVFLHSAQVSDVDSEVVLQGQRFEILMSELGINLEEGAQLAEGVARAAGSRTDVISTVNDIIALFQMGPKTGNPVFNDDFSDDMIHQIKLKCPSGRISGLTSVRETAKYPVVSGEIVKLIGYCLEGDSVMKNIFALVLMLSMGLVGCVHLGSVSTSSIPVDRSRPVMVEEVKFLPFLISFSNSFVDDVAKSLAAQCPNGRVEGVLTKQENITYFPLFAHAYRLTATGYCVGAAE